MAWTFLVVAGILNYLGHGIEIYGWVCRLCASVGTVIGHGRQYGLYVMGLPGNPDRTAYTVWTIIGAVGTVLR